MFWMPGEHNWPIYKAHLSVANCEGSKRPAHSVYLSPQVSAALPFQPASGDLPPAWWSRIILLFIMLLAHCLKLRQKVPYLWVSWQCRRSRIGVLSRFREPKMPRHQAIFWVTQPLMGSLHAHSTLQACLQALAFQFKSAMCFCRLTLSTKRGGGEAHQEYPQHYVTLCLLSKCLKELLSILI